MPSSAAFAALVTTSAAAPSLIDDAFAAVTVPSFEKAARRAANFDGSPRPGSSSWSTTTRALLARDLDGRDLGLELPARLRGARAPVRLGGEGVLILAREAVLRRDHVAAVAHVEVLVRIPEAVVDHRVDDLAVAHAVAAARLGQHVGRVGHALHAARDDDLRVADQDLAARVHHRLQSRAAHLVHRDRADRDGQPRLDHRLARGRLTHAGGQHVAQDRALDRGRARCPRASPPRARRRRRGPRRRASRALPGTTRSVCGRRSRSRHRSSVDLPWLHGVRDRRSRRIREAVRRGAQRRLHATRFWRACVNHRYPSSRARFRALGPVPVELHPELQVHGLREALRKALAGLDAQIAGAPSARADARSPSATRARPAGSRARAPRRRSPSTPRPRPRPRRGARRGSSSKTTSRICSARQEAQGRVGERSPRGRAPAPRAGAPPARATQRLEPVHRSAPRSRPRRAKRSGSRNRRRRRRGRTWCAPARSGGAQRGERSSASSQRAPALEQEEPHVRALGRLERALAHELVELPLDRGGAPGVSWNRSCASGRVQHAEHAAARGLRLARETIASFSPSSAFSSVRLARVGPAEQRDEAAAVHGSRARAREREQRIARRRLLGDRASSGRVPAPSTCSPTCTSTLELARVRGTAPRASCT